MTRCRRALIAGLALVLSIPLGGCAGGPGAPPGLPGPGALAGVALSVGASVGTYFLIRELD